MYTCETYNFGDRLRFGITFELSQKSEEYLGGSLWGSCCYWIFGKCIGNLSYGISLSNECWSEIESILKHSAKRSEDNLLFWASGEQIFQTLNKDIENDADGIIEENCFGFVGTCDYWKVYEVSLDLDIMEEHLFLFGYEDNERIIVAKLDKDKEHYYIQSEHFLKKGEFDLVVQEAFDWLQKRFQQE